MKMESWTVNIFKKISPMKWLFSNFTKIIFTNFNFLISVFIYLTHVR